MATAAPHGNNVPPSAADERLQASLDRIKFASSHYMDNPNNTTQARFSSASEEHVNALQGAGLSRQAGHMRKVDRDFRNATTRSKMLRIVVALARTLSRVGVMQLAGWGIAGAISATGVVYALYEIGDHGQLVDVSDINLDGWTDQHRIDIDCDGAADLTLVDQDFNGAFDTLVDGAGEVVAEGGWVETAVDFVSNAFS